MRLYLIRLYYTLIDVEKELRENKEAEWADKLSDLIKELQRGVIHERPKQNYQSGQSSDK